jgi:ECF sigma factor
MRRILVDKARAELALKRGGGQALPVCEAELVAPEAGPDLLLLDDAISDRTAERIWHYARTFLFRELRDPST